MSAESNIFAGQNDESNNNLLIPNNNLIIPQLINHQTDTDILGTQPINYTTGPIPAPSIPECAPFVYTIIFSIVIFSMAIYKKFLIKYEVEKNNVNN